MNILLNSLPNTVNIGGKETEIETDFRAGIKFELLIQKGEEDIEKLLEPFFPNGINENDLLEALRSAELFY